MVDGHNRRTRPSDYLPCSSAASAFDINVSFKWLDYIANCTILPCPNYVPLIA